MCSWYGGSRLLDDAVVGAVEASDVKDQARPRRVGRGVTTVKTPNTTSGKSFEVWTSQWVGKSVCCRAAMWIWAVKVREMDCAAVWIPEVWRKACGGEERRWLWDEKTVLEERELSLPEL